MADDQPEESSDEAMNEFADTKKDSKKDGKRYTEEEAENLGFFKGASQQEIDPDAFFEYVIVFDDVLPPTEKDENGDEVYVKKNSSAFRDWKDISLERRDVEQKIRASGVQVIKKIAHDKKKVFLLITASKSRLARVADQLDIKMRLKEQYGGVKDEDGRHMGGYAPYEVELKHMFEAHSKNHMFSTTQRIFLIRSILEQNIDDGGAGLRLESLFRRNIINKYFPMHHRAKRRNLLENWANWRKAFTKQPIEDIRNYFGEEIGLYFAWLGFFTKWLWIASVVGLVCFILWLISKLRQESWGLWVNTGYSIFLALWATCFQEYWKRKQNIFATRWGTDDWEETEAERADFKGELKPGLYWKNEWLEPSDLDLLDDRHTKIKSKQAPKLLTHAKVSTGMSVLLTMIGIVFAVTAAVLSFRLFVQKQSSLGGAIAGGAANAVTIIIMNVVWQKIAEKMTMWENHRTETEYKDNLVFKIFTFQFCNSYASFYYIAFFKGNTIFWGRNTGLDDGCRVDWGEDIDTVAAGCVDELTLQVLTVLLVNQFIGQTREVMLPFLLKKMKSVLFLRTMLDGLSPKGNVDEYRDTYKTLPTYEREALRVDWPGTFEEYSEMVIQYGYITLFAAVFPLAPFLALTNNLVEIRTDALKMLTQHNRPHYAGAQDIGTWYNILDVIGFFAVVTNCLLIGFSYSPIYKLANENAFQTFAIVVILEHTLLALKLLIAYIIPDVPEKVAHERARSDYIKYVAYKEAKATHAAAHNHAYSDSDDDDDAKDHDHDTGADDNSADAQHVQVDIMNSESDE